MVKEMRVKMPRFPESLSKRHVIALLIFIAVDMIATMIWYHFCGIEEANPLLAGPIKHSLVSFALVKLTMSLPGLLFLYKKIELRISQFGLGVLLFWYIAIFCIHWYILMGLLRGL